MKNCGKLMRIVAIILVVLLVGSCMIQFLSAIGPIFEVFGTVFEYLGKFVETGRERYLESAVEAIDYMIDGSTSIVLGFTQSALIYVFCGCVLYSLGVIIDKIKPAIKE